MAWTAQRRHRERDPTRPRALVSGLLHEPASLVALHMQVGIGQRCFLGEGVPGPVAEWDHPARERLDLCGEVVLQARQPTGFQVGTNCQVNTDAST